MLNLSKLLKWIMSHMIYFQALILKVRINFTTIYKMKGQYYCQKFKAKNLAQYQGHT